MMFVHESGMNYLGNLQHYEQFIAGNPINFEHFSGCLQHGKLLSTIFGGTFQIIVNCNNTGYHELYQLNILGINTNCVISVRLIERFRFVQNYQIFLLNNKMNLSSNDQQNARLVQSNTQ
ncbi:Hypothetical_protein [Hexamita inflata]|uniref:Hypothetical_protein n=1 Tax=Hexamita inflata TaxID=28002 RepID=A0AA86R587_9EUKA|nr:Hypothetical protein HINF_LOCUS55001 [Hexamita inflata]